MTKETAISRLFKAFGKGADEERMRIYLQAVSRFTDAEADAGVTRAIERTADRGLPVAGRLVLFCSEIRAEDAEERRIAGQREGPRVPRDTPEQNRVLRHLRELADLGLQWCGVCGSFGPMGMCDLDPTSDHGACDGRIPTLAETEAALGAAMRGELQGDPEYLAARSEKAREERAEALKSTRRRKAKAAGLQKPDMRGAIR